MKNYDVSTIYVNDVVHTLRECRRNAFYEHAYEHMLTFASELTGISEDSLVEMMSGKDESTDDSLEVTDEMIEELKAALWNNGIEAVDDLLGYEHDVNEDKDTTENRMDEVLDQMPDEEVLVFYRKYCYKAERVFLKTEDGSYSFIDEPDADDLQVVKGLIIGRIGIEDYEGVHECEKSALYDDMTGYEDKLQDEEQLDPNKTYIVAYFKYNDGESGLEQCVDFNVSVSDIVVNTLEQKYVEGAYFYDSEKVLKNLLERL